MDEVGGEFRLGLLQGAFDAFELAGPVEVEAPDREELLVGWLRELLGRCSGRPRLVERLWRRWLLEAHADEDLQALGLGGNLDELLGRLQSLGGLHNVKIDGTLDAATLRLWQQAVRQLTGAGE